MAVVAGIRDQAVIRGLVDGHLVVGMSVPVRALRLHRRAGPGGRARAAAVLPQVEVHERAVVVVDHVDVDQLRHQLREFKVFGLGRERILCEDRGVAAKARRLSRGLGNDLEGRGHGLGDDMGRVIPADRGTGHSAVVLRPGVGRFAPIVAGRRDDLLLHQDLAADRAPSALRQTALGAGRRHGRDDLLGMARRGDRDVLLIVVVVVGVRPAAQAVAIAQAGLRAAGFMPLIGHVSIGMGMGRPAVRGAAGRVIGQGMEPRARIAGAVDLRLDHGVGVHEVRLGQLGRIADQALLVKVELVSQFVGGQIIPSAAQRVALGNLHQQLHQHLQIVGRGLADAAVPVAVLSQAGGVAVVIALAQAADAEDAAGLFPEGGRLIVAHGLARVGVATVVHIHFPPAQDLTGVVAIGVLAGDADKLAKQRAHLARRQVFAAVALAGRRLDLGGVGRGVHQGGLAVAGEAPLRHGHGGDEVVAVDQVEDTVVLIRRSLRVRRVVRGGEGVGVDLLVLVDQIGGHQVRHGGAAGMARKPVGQRGVHGLVQRGLHVRLQVVFVQVAHQAGGAYVEAPVIGFAGPVGVALLRGLARHGVVLIKETDQVAHVKVGAPLLHGLGVRAAHPDGHDHLGNAVIGHGAMAEQGFAQVVVIVDGVQGEVDHVLKAQHLHQLHAVDAGGRAALPGLGCIKCEIRVGVVRRIVGQGRAHHRRRTELRRIGGVLVEEHTVVHRVADRGRAVMAGFEFAGKDVAVGRRVIGVRNAVEVTVGQTGVAAVHRIGLDVVDDFGHNVDVAVDCIGLLRHEHGEDQEHSQQRNDPFFQIPHAVHLVL